LKLEINLRRNKILERRSNLEIAAEILKLAKKGAKKTRIVYGANLNFKMLEEYLEKLKKSGLIMNSPDNDRLIKTTDKGREYLQQFYVLQQYGPKTYS
jgi:predicted transcriptional regulator